MPSPDAQCIRVPVMSFHDELKRIRPTYLMIDIEGGEIELLARALPHHVRAVCVETHPAVTGEDALSRTMVSLIEDGFVLDLRSCEQGTAFFRR